MSKGKGFLILVLAFMILSTLTAVSADNHADEIINTTGSDETGIVQTTQNNDILTKKDNGSFAALQNKINEAGEGASVTLENDYFFDEATDDSEGITVSKTITINGNGHAIDGLSKSRLLTATSQVTLKNIIFKNGYSTVKSPVYIENAANTTISHCTFTNNHLEKSGGYGGALTLYGGETQTIDSCTFASNSATKFGGAVCIVYIDQIRISSCTFTDNAAENGGSIFAEKSCVELSVSRFKNESGKYGGAIEFGDGSKNSLVTCSSFENCNVSASGGAIYVGYTDVKVSWCNFTNCQANYGGAVMFDSSSENSSVERSRFSRCIANTNGGALDFLSSGGAVDGCVFDECCASRDGGAILIESTADNFALQNSSFNSCQGKYGGAVLLSSRGCLINDSTFKGCLADASGGAIYFGGKDFRVLDSRFDGCGADWGGAIYLANNGADAVVNASAFYNCSAVNEGGAVSMKSSGGYLSHSNFTSCRADDGGAVYWNSADGHLSYCSFKLCRATDGGAVYWIGSYGALAHSRFSKCSADDDGGAIFWDSDYGKLSHCNFTTCNASYAGALYWLGSYGNAQYLSFDGCFASINSGAAMWAGSNGSLSNSVFNNCSVNYTGDFYHTPYGCGGAILWGAASGTLSMSSFSECTSSRFGGAVYWTGKLDGLVDGCNFTGCRAQSCGAAFVVGTRVSNSIFTGCSCLNECGGLYLMEDATLSDSTFINCSSLRKGGAVYSYQNNEIYGCNFIECLANDGAAIYCDGSDGIIRNSNFIDCHSNFFAGAIDWRSVNGTIDNCNFNNCSAVHRAGAVYWYNVDASIINCNFTDCSSKDGGAIFSYKPEGVVLSSRFINCRAENNGGAMYRGCARNCIFESNQAKNGGATYNSTALSSNFINNRADLGSAMYNGIANDKCIFNGNQNHGTEIIKIDIAISDFESTYNSGDRLKINLRENGNPVNDADVIIKVYENGALKCTYRAQTGNAQLRGLPAGVYEAICTVRNRGYELEAVRIGIKINPAPVVIITPAVTTTYNVNRNVVVTLKDSNNNPIGGVDMSINLNGVKYFTTDENGQFELSTLSLAPKTYTASIAFAGNDRYAKSTATSKVTINKASVKLTAANKSFKKKVKTKKYTVTLKNNKNGPMKNVKLKLNVKGKTYTATTNAKGQATFKITKLTKKGKHKATVTFAGDKYYNKAAKTVKITIK